MPFPGKCCGTVQRYFNDPLYKCAYVHVEGTLDGSFQLGGTIKSIRPANTRTIDVNGEQIAWIVEMTAIDPGSTPGRNVCSAP
jgi:hypothetical protein